MHTLGRFGADFPIVLAAAQAGDEPTWVSIYASLAPQVAGYLRSRGATDVDDLVGDVFLHLARGIERFEGEEPQFRSWVFMIATSRLIDERRRRGRRPTDPLSIEESVGLADRTNVEEEGLDALAAAELATLLSVLTPDQRIVMELRLIGGLTGEEIGVVIGKPTGAVKALQRRAIASLRRHLGVEKGEPRGDRVPALWPVPVTGAP